ncbi:MAG: Mor transcription activator family protein [Roseateles sp.]|uniref:Mor transcription activator family protein n=1 Tax=Roseateles sp. TaxID=1971397 RepID=UPI0040360BDF
MATHLPSDEALDIIEEEARAMAQCYGVAAPAEAAAALIERLLLRLNGAHIYMPKQSSRKRVSEHQEISRRFNGSNLFELAREFGMTPRHVRRILAKPRAGVVRSSTTGQLPRTSSLDTIHRDGGERDVEQRREPPYR